MTLRSLGLFEEYRSDEHDLARDLFIPCLSVATRYDRAVGYFTSSGLAAAARGLEAFVEHEGAMRLVASPLLRDEDVEAIQRGLLAQDDVIERALLRGLAFDVKPSDRRRLELLSWLVGEGRLEIRVAITRHPRKGIFHEKVGIFVDEDGDAVAVAGSANETQAGLVDNFETVDVFTSWGSTAGRVQRKRQSFDALWENNTKGLEIVSFPQAVRRHLLEHVPVPDEWGASDEPAEESEPPIGDIRRPPFGVPEWLELRPYQLEAIEAWREEDGVGVLGMATGSGKTITALAAASMLSSELHRPLVIVVLAPYVHLVDQWAREIEAWGARPMRCYGSTASWRDEASLRVDLFEAGATDVLCLVATHATASLAVFRELLARVPGPQGIVIGDEVHHLGSDTGLDALPAHFRYRLGLSATPERWGDPAGTAALLDYFGRVVFEFTIADAIAAGCLCPYEYRPELVDLTSDELVGYHEVTDQILMELGRPIDQRSSSRLRQLFLRRGELLDTAEGKLERLRESVESNRPDRTLVYCASRRQLSAVMELLWDRTIASRQFTGEESADIRRELLSSFASGAVPAVVAMKCLDEGVDIPQAREAYVLASSGNPMEFVQRRGRLLRLFPGKESAVIRDYVVIPDGRNERERDILRREARRVVEFANAAENRSTALDVIWPALERNGLLQEVSR